MTEKSQPSNPVMWFEIYVDDLARAKKFYEAVFKRPLEAPVTMPGSEMQMCTFTMNSDATGSAGALVKSPKMKPGAGGGTMIYFSCDDCAQEAARVSDNGGKVSQRKTSIDPYGFIAIVQDTEGNTIGLHSMK